MNQDKIELEQHWQLKLVKYYSNYDLVNYQK